MFIMLFLLLACQATTLEKTELKEVFENQWWTTDQELVEKIYDTDSEVCFIFYSEDLYEGLHDGMVVAYFLDLNLGDNLIEFNRIDDGYEFPEIKNLKLAIKTTEEGYEGVLSQGLLSKSFEFYACDN